MQDISENGKMWAVMSYAGMFMGLPIGLVPLLMREDPFAVQHAKHAVANFIGVTVAASLSGILIVPLAMCTFGLGTFLIFPMLMPLIAWPIVTNLHGIVLVANEEWDEPMGGFGLGDWMFAGVHAKDPDIIDV